jgi:hypothetical protein
MKSLNGNTTNPPNNNPINAPNKLMATTPATNKKNALNKIPITFPTPLPDFLSADAHAFACAPAV